MDHRRTTAGKTLTLPGWVIVSSTLICFAAAIFYVVLLAGGDDVAKVSNTSAPAARDRTAATIPPTPSAAPTTTPPTHTPSPMPTTSAPPTPVVNRDVPVAVYNNSRTAGLARSVAGRASAVGWPISATGNWRGAIPRTTVYYPSGLESQARRLAEDLGVARIRPAVSPMGVDRLTVILTGQQ